MTQEQEDKLFAKVVYIVYFALLLWFVIFKFSLYSFDQIAHNVEMTKLAREDGYWNVNFIPFDAYKDWYRLGLYDSIIENLAGNIIAFMPMGFLKGCIHDTKPLWKILLRCFVTILGIETLQLITCLGSFDIDDLTMNTFGCFLGYLCLKLFIFIYNKIES